MPEPSVETYLNPTEVFRHLGVSHDMVVGDFGVGGAAAFAVPASQAVGPSGSVLMFDVLKSSLSAALSNVNARGCANCKAVWSNLEVYGGASGVPDGSVDAGMLVNVLNQSDKHKDILAEIHRMLKPGAKLLVVDWKADASVPIAPVKEHRFPPGYLEQLAQSVGLAPFEQFEAGPYHWGLVLVKA